MDTVNLPEAEANLPQLVERAAAGEEIIIAKAGRPLARLVPFARAVPPRQANHPSPARAVGGSGLDRAGFR
jgi:prevent-host-death family protein